MHQIRVRLEAFLLFANPIAIRTRVFHATWIISLKPAVMPLSRRCSLRMLSKMLSRLRSSYKGREKASFTNGWIRSTTQSNEVNTKEHTSSAIGLLVFRCFKALRAANFFVQRKLRHNYRGFNNYKKKAKVRIAQRVRATTSASSEQGWNRFAILDPSAKEVETSRKIHELGLAARIGEIISLIVVATATV